MTRVVIVGGGIGGLTSALLLARAGHEVVVCERDEAPTPAGAEEAWVDWPRPGTPQARLGHSFLPGFRRLLEERMGDVLEQVLSAAALADAAADVPGGERLPQDAELTLTLARRPVLESVLRRCAESDARIDLVPGCLVTGLIADEESPRDVPCVTGVATRAHGRLAADTVIVAGGRSAPVARWLAKIGVSLDEEAEGCGFACYTRYFRLLSNPPAGGELVSEPLIHRDSDNLVYEIWAADAGTFAAEIIVPIADKPLHRLREQAVWTAMALSLPDFPDWIDAGRSQPITPGVAVMGQERNVLRRFVVDGRPLATGLHVVGDARCQTDSLFAWGCANALRAAVAVADSIAEHAGDAAAQALAVEAAVGEELAGRFRHSRERDRAALRAARGEPRWESADRGTGLIDELLYPAADHDAEVFRAVMRWDLQLDPADALEDRPALAERARRALADAAPADASPLPTRDELVEIVGAVAGPV